MIETIWFVLWGLLWAVYFILDGFDLGMGSLLPFLAKTEDEKRTVYNAAGPFWDGNEVWLVTAGGVTFAAFPKTYAVMFSSMYAALLLLLFTLIVRGVTFEFRNKINHESWRGVIDLCHSVCSFLPALLLGVAFANFFQGLPLDANSINQGGLFDLLNPYGLAGGLLFVLLFLHHGALWLAIKSEGALHDRAVAAAKTVWMYLLGTAVLFLFWSAYATKLWNNFLAIPILLAIPLIAVLSLFFSRMFLGQNKVWTAWAFSATTILGVAFFGVLGMFPALLPSSLNPAWSLTIHNSASSPYTLKIMLGVALTFVPIVILYQIWVYKTFSHKITKEDLEYEEAY